METDWGIRSAPLASNFSEGTIRVGIDATEPPRGAQIFRGRYKIERLIKSGGMGNVYAVQDLQTRRRRALKTMSPTVVSDPDLRDRFHLEATIAAEIRSDHIVEVFDAGIDEGTAL